jgi:diguanylate cyclase (GGDEF)-like protein
MGGSSSDRRRSTRSLLRSGSPARPCSRSSPSLRWKLEGCRTGGGSSSRLEEELDRSRRYGTHLALILVDIDNFKSVNDRYGHQCGDEVLRAVAPVLSGSLRELDLAGRFGGEEFALVLPGTAAVSARRIAEQIRRALAKVTVLGPGGELVGVTASFGAAEFPANASVASLIEAADRALYQAKRDGKDRVVVDGAAAAPGARERPVVEPA